jgi:dihydrofolate synthase/folylpolyglutamate synthase
VVTLPQSPQANDVIGNTIIDLGPTAVSAVPYVPPVSPRASSYFRHSESANEQLLTAKNAKKRAKDTEKSFPISRYPLQVMGKEILVETPLVGRHQLRNIALAVATAEELSKQGFAITPESIESGIRQTRWPGRFQVISAKKGEPEFVFDVAHNPAGAWALRSTLSSYYEDRRIIFVFGAMRDKAIAEVCEILFPLAECVIATQADNPRSASAEEVREAAVRTHSEIELSTSVESAIARASKLALSDSTGDAVVVVTGSIYIVGEAMRALGVVVDAK